MKKILLLLFYICTSQEINAKFQAIIFDMDGTIINTRILLKQAHHCMLYSYAPHLNQDQADIIVESLAQLTTPKEVLSVLQQHCCQNMSLDQIKEKRRMYYHNFLETEGVSFVNFFPEFHQNITMLGLQTALATNAHNHTLEKIMRIISLQDFFGKHIYPIDVVGGQRKPNPAIFLHAAKQLEVNPQDCIVIEDSAGGIAAAKAAGMYCIGINTGKNQTLLTEADEIVDCFSEIDVEKLLSI